MRLTNCVTSAHRKQRDGEQEMGSHGTASKAVPSDVYPLGLPERLYFAKVP